jgi:predicted enzyme related to lactoylglutathione lyase
VKKDALKFFYVIIMSAIVYFEIHFDDAERAKKFYTELFGWKVEKAQGTEYYMITTQEGTHGGMMKRFNTNQKITDYFGVHSIQESSAKVEKLGGKILVPKMASEKGYFALCMDPAGNVFGLWEDDPQAK